MTDRADRPEHGSRPQRSAAVRARRHPGIDYDGIPGSLAGTAVEPGDPAHRSHRPAYRRGSAPGLILSARTPAEVSEALAFARRHRDLPFEVRSGGTTTGGGLVLDVAAMDTIEVIDERRRLVRTGPGATGKQINAVLDRYGWALDVGDHGGAGVGGPAITGGIGLLSRHHGLTVDRVRAVELVLADGTAVRASAAENPDLFWAVRGAGATVGVATAFEFEAGVVGPVGWARLTLVSGDLELSLERYAEAARDAPRDTTVVLVTGRPRRGRSVIQLHALVDHPDPGTVAERLNPFLALGVLAQQEVVITSYAEVVAETGRPGFGNPVSRSAFVPELSREAVRDVTRMLRSGRISFFQLRHLGGAIGDIPGEATAFAHRGSAFEATGTGSERAAVDGEWTRLARHFDGLHLGFDTGRLRDAFPAEVLPRLRQLKHRYDPTGLFRGDDTIGPDETAARIT